MKEVATWLLDNPKILEEFLSQGIALHQWEANLEFEQKVVSGLDGVFKIDFICPIHKESNSSSYKFCEIELAFWLIRHNPIYLKHTRYFGEGIDTVDKITLLDEEDFIHLEGKDNKKQIKEAKKLIYKRLEVEGR